MSSKYPLLSNTSPLVFPSDLRQYSNRSIIVFTAEELNDGQTNHHQISFPCPSDISFSEGADYSTMNLGVFGEDIAKTAQNVLSSERGEASEALLSSLSQSAARHSEEDLNLSSIATIVAKSVGGNNENLINFANRSIINPRTNTTFGGNTIRQFAFSFSMIGRTEADSKTIHSIISKFRLLTYAEQNGINLNYPPTWKIQFMIGGQENKFIPKIYKCFLTSVTTNINPGIEHLWRKDGAPIQTQISLNFQETKVLTRQMLSDLESDNKRNDSDNVVAEKTVENVENQE